MAVRPVRKRGHCLDQGYSEVGCQDQSFSEITGTDVGFDDPKRCPWPEDVLIEDQLAFSEDLNIRLISPQIIMSGVMAIQ
jgi:hypothetical protein